MSTAYENDNEVNLFYQGDRSMNLNEYQNYHEIKQHTNEKLPYNIYICAIPDNFPSVPLHWHEELEMIVIKNGSGRIQVDFRTYHVHQGDLVTILPGQLHAVERSNGGRMEYENIIFKAEFLASASAVPLLYEKFLSPMIAGTHPIPAHLNQSHASCHAVQRCIAQIDHLCDARPFGYQLAVQGLLLQIVYYLLNTPTDLRAPASESKNMDKLRAILRYVEEHYAERISLQEAADLTYYSKSYFMKFFRHMLGVSFVEYVNEYRLTMAARLLHTGNWSVADAAGTCGFENLSHFHRLFKRKYHMTPYQYKNNRP